MITRALQAWINQTPVGLLEEANGLGVFKGSWRFQYSADWLTNPNSFALSPHLPLTPHALSE
jgi:serine/threonine-protein kinase HipA